MQRVREPIEERGDVFLESGIDLLAVHDNPRRLRVVQNREHLLDESVMPFR